jgi:hypothetical protein
MKKKFTSNKGLKVTKLKYKKFMCNILYVAKLCGVLFGVTCHILGQVRLGHTANLPMCLWRPVGEQGAV